MNIDYENTLRLFIANRDALKRAFPWESVYLLPLIAGTFAARHMTVNEGGMRSLDKSLKAQTGAFSTLRGMTKVPILGFIAVTPDPERKLQETLQVHDMLRKYFSANTYLPLAAAVIATQTTPELFENTAARTRAIFDLMRKEHPFLTSSEDYVFAAMLALSPLSDERIVGEAEACYQGLIKVFKTKNAAQSLGFVLAISDGDAAWKVERTIALYRMLKENGMRFGKYYELSTLGTVSTLPGPLEEIVGKMRETDQFLKKQKGYGFWGPGMQQRLMHAAMLVSADARDDSRTMANTSAATGSAIAMIAAQQAAMCAVIAASVASSSAAASAAT